MITIRRFFFLLAALLAFHAPGRAEDIDLFAGGGGTLQPPNLLLIMDNAGAFNSSTAEKCIINNVETALSGKAGGIEQCALYRAIEGLNVSGSTTVNIGIMVYTGNGINPHATAPFSSCAGNSGGCLVYPLTRMTTATKADLLAYIAAWSGNGAGNTKKIQANNQGTGAVMQEAWAYYKGKVGISGTDYSQSPVVRPATNCKNFIVYVGNAYGPNGSPGDSAGPKAALVAEGDTKALITAGANTVTSCGTVDMPAANNHENKGFYMDEWARFMRGSDLKIRSYTIGLIGSGCKAEYTWLLDSTAEYGDGHYYQTTNYAELREALETVLSEVRSVNSVFAAVSLPVSVNTQGTYLNQVYIGMFRPDQNRLPNWMGNLKQYKMGYDTNGKFRLLDAAGKPAISSAGSEFISECARSYWTPTTADAYWSTYTDVNCVGYAAASNSPDGNLVEKGGQAYRLRKTQGVSGGTGAAARVVKTCASLVTGCQTVLTDFSTLTSGLSDTLVRWARGENLQGEVASADGTNPISTSAMRPSVHGDVVHSRPAAISFGSNKVVVLYGGNDGVFRAVNGNRSSDSDPESGKFTVGSKQVYPGDEFWSFIPPEFYGKIQRRYNDTQEIDSTNPKDYAMDGPVTAYRDAGGDAWAYVGMRRGGRSVYAFKIDKTSLAVDLKWKIGCVGPGTGNCSSSDFNTLGQTWAPPQVITAAGYTSGGTASPLLVMGGGYDATCEDTVTPCASPSTGKGIYVVDAITGTFKKLLATEAGVVADVTVVPGSDGHAAYIYAVDLRGNVYRVSGPRADSGAATAYPPIGNAAPSTWVIKRIASLGCDTLGACTAPSRKFMFAPDIVLDNNDYIVLVGSGDREKPTNTSNATANYFFKIVDRPDQGNNALTDSTNCTNPGQTTGDPYLCLNSLLSIAKGTTPSNAELASKPKGWRLALSANEQVTTAGLTIAGIIYFTTHEPKAAAANSCNVNLGTLRNYSVGYSNASGSGNVVTREDGGLAPDPVAGKVTLDGPNGKEVPFCIGCVGPLEANQPPSASAINNTVKIRSYWFIEK